MSGAAGYLLDTNVISETRKTRPNADVMDFLANADGGRLFVSVLTLGELRKGVEAKRRGDPVAAAALSAWVDVIESGFIDRIVDIDAPTARLWGELSAARRLSVVDTLIAATALRRDLTLVTRNVRDVAATGAAVLDPWADK